MNTIRNLLLSAAIMLGGIAACNYTVGECYYRGEGGATGSEGVTAGGGVIVPSGPSGAGGGFGDAPPRQPQDATNPDPPICNIVTLSPCHEQCEAEDEARAIECAKIQDEAQRRACNDSSHEKYMSCIKECKNTPKDTCQEKWERCANYAPWSCRKGPGSESMCYKCWDQCTSGAPPSSACRKCLF
jgi:hypothetical protein